MPELKGRVYVRGGTLRAYFISNPITTFAFEGHIDNSIIKENVSTTATLQYKTEDQLEGKHKFEAVFGPKDLIVTLNDGVAFRGPIKKHPRPTPVLPGEGEWFEYHFAPNTDITVEDA
ncbi:hypothetical protein SISNIDRAFT_548884 [Sistotremastrum niveocremeum HHB9708]|uniref:Uncharacterized protein n=2 Tax=Sistotremastraceae TaxID=3402574 RepID=A0A164WF65_9AGAM|nr:hypothetical protein SISNIDRAFT_548884 [Sistotremastrum niveocremeum HHB9708]KZT34279.1 hypothetical protein SISSUDRAFT_1122356 [Sistotremastrum suecicum HHB10207 ss-3]